MSSLGRLGKIITKPTCLKDFYTSLLKKLNLGLSTNKMESFYKDMSKGLKKNRTEYNIVIGDFNCTIVKYEKIINVEKCIGKKRPWRKKPQRR